MRDIKIKSLGLESFKGHKSLLVNFNELQTIISGENRIGKSTVLDAFLWSLFGKDAFGRTNFEITPIIDGVKDTKIDSIVVNTLEINGVEVELKRVFHPQWVRKTGELEAKLTGYTTDYFINTVSKSATEYKNFVKEICDEEIFKLITSTAAFFNLKWEKQRSFLFEIAGTVSDQELASYKPEFQALLDLLTNKSLVDFKKELSARKKRLKEELEKINPSIQTAKRLTPEAKDFASIEVEVKLIEEEIKKVDSAIVERNNLKGDALEEEKKEKIAELKRQQAIILKKEEEQAEQDFNNIIKELKETNAEVVNIDKNMIRRFDYIKEQQKQVQYSSNQIEDSTLEKGELLLKWKEVSAREYKQAEDGCFICPAFNHKCQDQTALTKAKESEGKGKESFLAAKAKELELIKVRGTEIADRIKSFKQIKEDLEKEIISQNDLVVQLESLKKGLVIKSKELSEIKKEVVIAEEIAEWNGLQFQINTLQAQMPQKEVIDNSDLVSKKAQLIVKRDNLKSQLADRETIKKHEAEVARLEAEGRLLAQKIAEAEGQEFTAMEFSKMRTQEAEKRINSRFEVCNFTLFEYTYEGGESETCIPTNKKGVPISATNTEEKINAGLDIIRTLSEFYNIKAPVFIDCAESVNSFINIFAQMVYLKVSKEKVLTVK